MKSQHEFFSSLDRSGQFSARRPENRSFRSGQRILAIILMVLFITGAGRWAGRQIFGWIFPPSWQMGQNVIFHEPAAAELNEVIMEEDGMPYLFQFDEDWKDVWYGDGPMAQTGCGPTSLAMAVQKLTGSSISPSEIARYAEQNGYYAEGAGTAWALFTDYPTQLGLQAWQSSLDAETISSNLQAGNPVLFSVGPGDFTTSGHIIAVSSMDEAGNVYVHDPYSQSRSKRWPLQTLLDQAAAAFVIQNPSAAG